MKPYALLILLLAACASPPAAPVVTTPSDTSITKTALKDPSVLILNQTTHDTVYFTWRDGQGIAGTDTVLPTVTACARFTAQVDSASWSYVVRDWPYGPNNPPDSSTGHIIAPLGGPGWFNPADRPAWRMTVSPGAGSPQVMMAQDSTVKAC